jgi:hypothetical protein
MTHRKPIIALAGAAGMLLGASVAIAQSTTVACNDTSVLPNPIFMGGSSAFEPILSQLAVQIKAKQQVSVIYASISSCNGVSAISPPADNPVAQPLTGTAHYYTLDPTDSTKVVINSCSLSGNTMASIGVSDVAFDSCQGVARPATIGEWAGPQQPMLIIVPKANVTTTAISSDQAAAIWGCGAKSGVGAFTNESAIQQRSATSGTQILVARSIGVPETAFKGVGNSSGGTLVTSLLAVPNPQTAIGFLANDAYATRRSVLNSVAFRGIGQKKAYYADSTATADDLKNVRDGHYLIQGPLHFFSKLDSAGQPAANAKLALDWLTGAAPIDTADPNSYVRIVATAGDVPQCAMKVTISKDGGYFSPYTPPVSCGCAFDKAKNVALPAGVCTPCTTDTTCTGGTKCQFGYCE